MLGRWIGRKSADSYKPSADADRDDVIFALWTGGNAMSAQRSEALLTLVQNSQCPVQFIDQKNLRDFEIAGSPFHPAYEYLSETHKSDYLRAYLMHFRGGGYSDIKRTSKSWRPAFTRLRSSDSYCVGYREIGPHGVAQVGGALQDRLRDNYQRLIGMTAFIFRPATPLTQAWIDGVHAVLDEKLDALRRHPARWPQDTSGEPGFDGAPSPYPLAWTELLGHILHPLVLNHCDRVGQADIAPSFEDYR